MNRKREDYTIEYFSALPSTSLYAKERRGEKKNLIVVADSQTNGMGTKGRSFSSAQGGIYLSVLTFLEDFPSKEAFKIMANCALSVCEILLEYGLKPLIKWPNDVYVNDKKICGILIENLFSGDKIIASLVGIGVNVYNSLPPELHPIATTVSEGLQTELSHENLIKLREKLIDKLLEEKTDLMTAYRSYVGYMGREATLLIGDQRVPATLLSVDKEGRLLVRTETGEHLLSAAEVSVRIGN